MDIPENTDQKFISKMTDWDPEAIDAEPYKISVEHDGPGVAINLDNGSGELTTFYIEIQDGKPVLHISTTPDDGIDLNILIDSNEITVEAERESEGFKIDTGRSIASPR